MKYGEQKVLAGFRRVQLQWGDTLQRIAARELGDASLWPRLAAINGLAPPYVTGDPAVSGKSVLMYGETLIIPAPTTEVSPGQTWSEDVFLRDVDLTGGVLGPDGGDFDVVEGRANLQQAIRHRVQTERGELIFHQRYGCRVHELKGDRNRAVSGLIGAAHVRDAVSEDPRISKITNATADVAGDTINITVEAETVSGHPLDVKAKA